jgi:hypothetical protein
MAAEHFWGAFAAVSIMDAFWDLSTVDSAVKAP